jgi:hypothetical protein
MTRQVIPAGEHADCLTALRPIAAFLIERGHLPVTEPDLLGFTTSPGGWYCALEGALTPDDWAAVQDAFELPPTIVYEAGCIRDHANWVDIQGTLVL